ncbi:MAG TPA: nitroreductase family deazaflavin-dependent oxidoreductase [Trebonia sp.]|nr:nitroreductase family deazaflavin-dependent oxidoreductase [Trebonia sp.]
MPESQYRPTDLTLLGDEHVRAYQDSGGEVGYVWNGVPTLLLTVTGRRSGRPLTRPLIFGRDHDDYLVVASYGGAPHHPSWYLNLAADPNATIQVQSEHKPVIARTASVTEKPRLWKIMTDVWPNYDVYQSRTARDIPLVILSPV